MIDRVQTEDVGQLDGAIDLDHETDDSENENSNVND